MSGYLHLLKTIADAMTEIKLLLYNTVFSYAAVDGPGILLPHIRTTLDQCYLPHPARVHMNFGSNLPAFDATKPDLMAC